MRMLLAVLCVMVACNSPKSPVPLEAAPSTPQKHDARLFSGKHANGTLTVSFLPGSRHAISSGVDDTARLWDLASGTELKRYTGQQYRFQSVAFAPQGDFALTPGTDGSLNYWKIDNGQLQRKLTDGRNTLGAVALSGDGKWAAGGGQDTAIYLWDLSSNSSSSARRLEAGGPVVQIAFHSSNGLYAVLNDGHLCDWSLDQVKPLRCTTALAEPVGHATFSSDGHKVLIGGTYGTLVLWDLDKQAEIRKLEGTSGDIVALALSPSGAFALSGGADKTVRLWDVSSGHQVTSTPASGDYVSSVAFSSDENTALFGTSDGSVALWQVK